MLLLNYGGILFFIKTTAVAAAAADFMKFVNGYSVNEMIGFVLYAEPRLTCTACPRGLTFIFSRYLLCNQFTVPVSCDIIINVRLKSSNSYNLYYILAYCIYSFIYLMKINAHNGLVSVDKNMYNNRHRSYLENII